MTNLENRLKYLTDVTSGKRINSKFSYIDPDEVIELLKTGVTMPQIAEIYNCTPNTVSYQIKTKYPSFNALKDIKRNRLDIPSEKIVKLYQKMKSSTRIAKILGTSSNTVLKRLRREGVEIEKRVRDDISNEEILSLYRVYKAANKVGEIVRMSGNAVRDRLHTMGVEVNRNWLRRTDLPHDKIIKAYGQGSNILSLAEKYGACYETIRRIIARGGELRGIGRTDVTVKTITQLYKKYGAIKEVARQLGTSETTVRSRIKEMDFGALSKYKKEWRRRDIPENKVVRLYESGKSLEYLSDKFDSCPKTIATILDRNDIKRRSCYAHMINVK